MKKTGKAQRTYKHNGPSFLPLIHPQKLLNIPSFLILSVYRVVMTENVYYANPGIFSC